MKTKIGPLAVFVVLLGLCNIAQAQDVKTCENTWLLRIAFENLPDQCKTTDEHGNEVGKIICDVYTPWAVVDEQTGWITVTAPPNWQQTCLGALAGGSGARAMLGARRAAQLKFQQWSTPSFIDCCLGESKRTLKAQ